MARLKHVLFVCLGNACRSQMAEAFARTYGSDIMRAASAGVMPAAEIPELTHEVMREKNITLQGHYPKGIGDLRQNFDLVVNMSGMTLPLEPGPALETWTIEDPIGQSAEVYRAVRDEIENRVMRLILNLRLDAHPRTAATRLKPKPKRI